MKKFIFLRHAEYQQPSNTPSAHLPYPLNEFGFEQSKLAVNKILNIIECHKLKLFPYLFSSSLLRSHQTAKIIMHNLNLNNTCQLDKVIDCDELTERSLGNFSNLSIEQIDKLINLDDRYKKLPDNWKSDSAFKLPGLGTESLLEAGERVKSFILKSLEFTSDADVVVFIGHGASFRHACLHMGLLKNSEIKMYSMQYAEPMLFGSSDSIWTLIDGNWKLRQKDSKHD